MREFEKITPKDAKKELEKSAHGRVHATLEEIKKLIACFVSGDFDPMKETNLYIKYGSEYCHLLEILH